MANGNYILGYILLAGKSHPRIHYPTMPLLDIILQFGDSFSPDGESGWIGDLINTILGAAIGSGATIYALYRTIKQDRINEEDRRNQDKIKEEERRRRFQEEKLKYFQSLVEAISIALHQQIEAFKAYADEVKSNPLELPLLSYNILGELDVVVNRINQEDYYHSYLGAFDDTQNSINEFRDIMSTLNYFDANLTLIKESLNKSFNYDHTRKISLSALIDKIEEHAALMVMNQEITNNYPDLHTFINDFMLEFTLKIKPTANLKSYHDHLFLQMKNELLKFGRTVPLAHHMLTLLRDATIRYNDILRQNLSVAETFEGFYLDMNMGRTKLLEQSKRLLEFRGLLNSVSA